jgi:hypothetical protein
MWMGKGGTGRSQTNRCQVDAEKMALIDNSREVLSCSSFVWMKSVSQRNINGVWTREHGRRSNDRLSDSPQDGSQGRAPYTRGESALNLSDNMSGYCTGAQEWRKRKGPSVERPLN